MTSRPLALKGAPGSPYTRKMLAVLRYRRIPYHFIVGSRATHSDLPKPKVELLPTFYFPRADGSLEAMVDSTPIIRRLEIEHAARSVIPADPVIRFIDSLIEDYADEWLTKAMFHYRWHYAADIEKSGDILPRWRAITASDERQRELKTQFAERQISRLHVVGSNAITAPVIEAGYARFLDRFEAHLRVHPYLMGARPGASDFAVYGQLSQLAHFDPTPAALTLARAKRVYAWVGLIDDLSGVEPDDDGWITRGSIPPTLMALLREAGRGYVPVMLANARALKAGASQVEAQVDGQAWVQQAFPYQGKCLQWLREAFAALAAADQTLVMRLLAQTGCRELISGDDTRVAPRPA